MVTAAILQVHPTRLCNLTCLHCYSSSGPRLKSALGLEMLKAAVEDAAAEGYRVLSVSGGEPLLYPQLPELLRHARGRGMNTALTTNGMLLAGRRLASLIDCIDTIAISLDGKRDSHNRMRNSDRAFDAMVANLAPLRSTGIPFGFIFTLTQYNLDELEWVYEFASTNGASLLQIHPLEMAGRAQEELPGQAPDAIEAAHAFLQWLRLRKSAGDSMRLQIDFADRRSADMNRSRYVPPKEQSLPLGQLVSPLVVEADGVVVPFVYGLNPSYALGSLQNAPLRGLARDWLAGGYPRLRNLCAQTIAEAERRGGLPIFNWYELLVEQSHLMGHPNLDTATSRFEGGAFA